MDKAIEILTNEVASSSQGKVAKELKVSKTSVNLLLKEKYPNPENMYKKIQDVYGDGHEIIGISVSSVDELKDLVDLMKDIECI